MQVAQQPIANALPGNVSRKIREHGNRFVSRKNPRFSRNWWYPEFTRCDKKPEFLEKYLFYLILLSYNSIFRTSYRKALYSYSWNFSLYKINWKVFYSWIASGSEPVQCVFFFNSSGKLFALSAPAWNRGKFLIIFWNQLISRSVLWQLVFEI